MKFPSVYMSLLSLLFLNPLCSFAQEGAGPGNNTGLAFIGTYTKEEGHVKGQAEGIYTVFQEPQTGVLKLGETVAEITNPSFVKTSPDGKYLYAVSELGPGDAGSGFVYSFRILPDHSLEEINKVSTVGFAPCHIEIDASGQYVLVSNYSGGIVVLYERIDTGGLREKQVLTMENQQASHPHSVTLNAANTKAYIADLGNDKIWIYDLDLAAGCLSPANQAFVSLAEGAGPRHFVLSKNGRFAYSVNELDSSVSVFKVGEGGGLELQQNITTLPRDYSGKNAGADIHLHPSGEYLYSSNRGHNSIAVFKVDPVSGRVDIVGFQETLGETPRNFALSSDGEFLYVANQDSSTITSFKINPATGELDQYLEPLKVKTPVCIEFM